MSKFTNFVTRPIAAAAAIAMLSLTIGSAQAAVHINHIDQADAFDPAGEIEYPVSSTDLINQGVPSFGVASFTGGTADFGSDFANLNNGNPGTAGNLATTAAVADDAWVATFTLVGSATGYDITSIETFAGWNSTGNIDQDYELFLSVVDDPTFVSFGDYPFDADSATGGSTRITLTSDTGVILSGVDAVRFSFPSLANNLTGVYREIDVNGVATSSVIPEPSSMAFVAVGLVGMISRRKRNRC